MIAAASITLWAAAAAAEGNTPVDAPASEATPVAPAPPPQSSPVPQPAAPVPPVASPQTVAPVPPSAIAPVPATGTPATVLDTQDYEGVLGKAVRSSTGEDMGRIIDIILDKDGRPRAAIIDFGGFLGVGSRKIAVDWRSMRFAPDGKPSRLVLQLSRNQVRVSPEYKPGDPIVVLGPASPSVPPDGDQAAAPAPAQIPAPAQVPTVPQPGSSSAASPDKPAEKTPDK
nr:PRC-barrel domain-containing protein [Methylobacterium sp. 77]